MDQSQSIAIRGQTLHLLPEKLIEWPARKTLLVADTHFGKAATFRNFGIPVPEITTHAMIERLSSVIARTKAERLIVLGDFIHSSVKNAATFEAALTEWRRSHRELEIILLRGNHDRGRNDFFAALEIRVIADSLREEPFLLSHAGGSESNGELYGLSGHIHPQIALFEGRKKLRLPCFWFANEQGILPAFGNFTGCATVKPEETDSVFVIADSTVVKVTELALARKGGSKN